MFINKKSFFHFGISVVIFLLSLSFCLFRFTKTSSAQIPDHYVECNDTTDEFHSLRPYQASPCIQEVTETALFCGNDLLLKDEVVGSPPLDPYSLPDNCSYKDQDKIVCKFNKHGTKPLNIDLSGAELPIMGNTESFTNSQNQSELSDPQDESKVNEYVSWYLNGVIGRAEYPFLSPDSKRIVNYSGPLKKLLPWETQILSRIETIKNAKVLSHNEIVACKYGIPLGPGQLGGFPGPCYLKGLIGDVADKFFISFLRLKAWENKDKIPPLPNDKNNQGEKKYKTFIDWLIAYKKWRGKECKEFSIPDSIGAIKFPPFLAGLSFFVCYNDLSDPDYFGNLFPYIPLSSLEKPAGVTEDRKGSVEVSNYSVYPEEENVKISNVVVDSQPAELFFSHMEETNQLADLLQSTYVPKGNAKSGDIINIAPGKYCNLVNIRTNKGDDLFATEISGSVTYDAEFSCEFDVDNPVPCQKDVYINLNVKSRTPKINEIWTRLVAGSSAVVQRMFPKMNTSGSLGSFLDIPGATKVVYAGAEAGNPAGPRAGESAELYFPHVGGVYEYFLKGIQTALRPKGYGESISFGEQGQDEYGSCKYTLAEISAAMEKAASKYGVPVSLLKAIFEIEALEFIANPNDYVCQERNDEHKAAGLMQTTRAAYDLITCSDERYENYSDIGVCKSEGKKLSRCDVNDTFELAARELMGKAGRWNYAPQCSPIGQFPADSLTIYKAACAYYGSCEPDQWTIQYGYNLPCPKRTNGDMNYCDIVWNKMHEGNCQPYPDQNSDCPYH